MGLKLVRFGVEIAPVVDEVGDVIRVGDLAAGQFLMLVLDNRQWIELLVLDPASGLIMVASTFGAWGVGRHVTDDWGAALAGHSMQLRHRIVIGYSLGLGSITTPPVQRVYRSTPRGTYVPV